MKKYFVLNLTNMSEYYSVYYEKVIIFSDLNLEAENKVKKDLL